MLRIDFGDINGCIWRVFPSRFARVDDVWSWNVSSPKEGRGDRSRRGSRSAGLLSSTMSTFGGGIRHSPSTFNSSPASTTLFRRLTWEGTVPLEIRVDSKELPANSNRGLECYFIQTPRVSYLPLLVPEIKRFLQDVVFDDEAARLMKEEEWWFESEEGHLLKW